MALAGVAPPGPAQCAFRVGHRGLHGVMVRAHDDRALRLGLREGPGQAHALVGREGEIQVRDVRPVAVRGRNGSGRAASRRRRGSRRGHAPVPRGSAGAADRSPARSPRPATDPHAARHCAAIPLGGGYVCTLYDRTAYYEGVEGELYNLNNDPRQWENLWDNPTHAKLKSDLLADLKDHLPTDRTPPLEKVARV